MTTTDQQAVTVAQIDVDAAAALDDALGFLTEIERPIVVEHFARYRHRLASVSSACADTGVWGKWHKMTLALVNAIHRDDGVKTQTIGIEQSYTQALAVLAASPEPVPATNQAGEVAKIARDHVEAFIVQSRLGGLMDGDETLLTSLFRQAMFAALARAQGQAS
jgi:hypothetical protein